MNNDFCFRPIWLQCHLPTDQQWDLRGDANNWVLHEIPYFNKILNGWEWRIEQHLERTVLETPFPVAQTQATDPFPGTARACALAMSFHFLVLGSHQCVFHRDIEISWGKPGSAWKKQAVVASPPGMGKLLAWKGLHWGAQPLSQAIPWACISSGVKNKDLRLSSLRFP